MGGGDCELVLPMPSLAVDGRSSANMHHFARQLLHCFAGRHQSTLQQCEQAVQCFLIGVRARFAHEWTVVMTTAHFEVCAYCSTEDGKGIGWGWAQAQNAPGPHQQGPDVQRALALGGHIVLVFPY